MTLTLLIDLDDTLLLKSSSDVFPAYIEALSNHLKFLAEPEIIRHQLFQATRPLGINTNPQLTLKQLFDDAFYPCFGVSAKEVEPELENFYTNIYPSLSKLAAPNPDAVKFIKESFHQGYTVAIATNPYFPRLAIEERLRWANLPPEDYPFSLLTSFETFHFTKPHLAYYAEVLARLGWPDTPVVMVGNDYEMDIAPAKSLGLTTYQIDSHPITQTADNSARGPLSEISAWLKNIPDEAITSNFNGMIPNLEIMRSTPAALVELLAQIPPAQWANRAAPEEWSPTEIICHLRDVDREVHMPRFEMVQNDPQPFLTAVDADTWAQERNYIQQDGPQALKEFVQGRTELLSTIQNLSPTAREKNIQHTIFGPTTLEELVKIAARHDRLHIQQLYAQIPG
jgi:FMN phosphatase YigB (HAD superfamily)